MKNLLGLFMAMTFFSFLANAQEKKANSEKLLRHVVLFKFTDTSSEWDVKKVEEAFRALPKRIKEVHSFEWGKNNSPENLNQGFTHCFFLTFKSEADREVYLPHPAHLAFVEVLKPHLDKVLVIDYWADK
ncbi:Dabb family protein [Flavihumibacter sediminis]|nr:Dabb family protein [Flavihumibacter sediminis]